MTGVLPSFEASPFVQNPWKLFRNTTAETIPPFSVLRITGAENHNGAIRLTVAKPNATQATVYMVNGPHAVAAGKDGICTTLKQAGYLSYDDSDGTPALGDSYGAKSGQWSAKKGVAGFFICGGAKLTGNINAVAAIQIGATSEPQVALAEFRAHTSPTYDYPLPEDLNEDNVFPAWIQRAPTFIDDTTDGGFTENQSITWPGGYDFDQEPVIVYSLRKTYIPPSDPGGSSGDRIRPIFKINEKWYCDYSPTIRLTFTATWSSNSGGSVTPSTTATYDQVASSGAGGRRYEGASEEQYSPLQVADDGTVTAYRDMDCLVTIAAQIRCTSTAMAPGTVYGAGTITKTGASTADTSLFPPLHFSFTPIDLGGGVYNYGASSGNVVSTSGLVRFTAGETLRFQYTNNSNSTDVNGNDLIVTLTPIESLNW